MDAAIGLYFCSLRSSWTYCVDEFVGVSASTLMIYPDAASVSQSNLGLLQYMQPHGIYVPGDTFIKIPKKGWNKET